MTFLKNYECGRNVKFIQRNLRIDEKKQMFLLQIYIMCFESRVLQIYIPSKVIRKCFYTKAFPLCHYTLTHYETFSITSICITPLLQEPHSSIPLPSSSPNVNHVVAPFPSLPSRQCELCRRIATTSLPFLLISKAVRGLLSCFTVFFLFPNPFFLMQLFFVQVLHIRRIFSHGALSICKACN